MFSDYILAYLKVRDPEAVDNRNPTLKRPHRRGHWSAGPHEEWCMDGHEKLVAVMGIHVWGVVDKCSRGELGLWAVPESRTMDVPNALYLSLVKEVGGEYLH
jgi:hypothetical protein